MVGIIKQGERYNNKVTHPLQIKMIKISKRFRRKKF